MWRSWTYLLIILVLLIVFLVLVAKADSSNWRSEKTVELTQRLQPREIGPTIHATSRRYAERLADSEDIRHGDVRPGVAEIIAWGGELSPGRAVSLWLASPPHRKILLSKHYNRIGCGAAHRGFTVYVCRFKYLKEVE